MEMELEMENLKRMLQEMQLQLQEERATNATLLEQIQKRRRCRGGSGHRRRRRFRRTIWSEVAKFLDGKSLVKLASTSRWFRRVIMQDDAVWNFVCLRDLHVPPPQRAAFRWSNLYTSAFDGSHSYLYRQHEKHIDWMRIGAFSFDSSVALLTEKLEFPGKIAKEESVEMMLQSQGYCVLDNVKPGIWIADLQLLGCPICDRDDCDGTLQTLEARHIELFLCEGYQNGSWEYQLVGSHDVKKQVDAASGAIFDVKHLEDSSTSAVFDYKSWTGRSNGWPLKSMIAFHAVAVNTNLQKNEGLHVKYHAMRAGTDGEVVAIRVSQQLL